MITLQITEHQVAEDDFETIIVEETETGTIVRTIATVHVPEYAEQFLDNAALRARVGEQQTQAKIDVLNELLQEIDETVYVETWGYIEQKRDELSVALAKGAK